MRSIINLLSAAVLCLGLTQSTAWAGPFVNGDFSSFTGWSGAVRGGSDPPVTVNPTTDARFALPQSGFAGLYNDSSFYEVVLSQGFDLDASARTLRFDYAWALTAGDPDNPDLVQAVLWLADRSVFIDLFPLSLDTSAPSGSGSQIADISALAGSQVLLEFVLQDGDFDELDWFEIGHVAIVSEQVPLPATLALLLPGLGLCARRGGWSCIGRRLTTPNRKDATMRRTAARRSSTSGPGLRRWSAVLGLLVGLLTLATPALAEFLPVTDPAFLVTASRPILDTRTQTYLLDVTIAYRGGTVAPGQYRLVVATANKTALEPMGTTAANEPFYGLLSGQGATFAAGTTLRRQLKFSGGRGQLVATLRLEREIPAPPNEPPTANAGPAQTLTLASGQTTLPVTLNGSASADPDGSIAGYQWTGSPQPASVAQPQIALPTGVHQFSLVVTDNAGAVSAPATVTITINPSLPQNLAPVANAGAARSIVLYPGEDSVSVRLDGSASADADGTLAGYHWSGAPVPAQTQAPAVTLGEGAHQFALVVVDDQGAESAPATVKIDVERLASQQAPQLHVPASPLTVIEGGTLGFAVTATDPNGHPVALGAQPLVPNATFSATNGVNASGQFSFTPDLTQAGSYEIVFTARDSLGLAASASVTVQVLNANRPPTLAAASRYEVAEGQVLSFAVNAADPDGDLVTLTASGVPTNAVFIPGSATVSFAPDFSQAGTYQVTFAAQANGQSAASVPVEIVVTDVPTGQAGTANALVLQVNPTQSPTLINRARITGSVNAEAGAPVAPPVVSALVTGLAAASGRQGETLSVVISGAASGIFQTGFAGPGSVADFGPGISVTSLTVAGPATATAAITIAADAAPGPRAVTLRTGPEVAVSVVAFNVLPGATTVTGQLLDPDTGLPVVGARVSVQGTGFSGLTDAQGRFTINGAPAGAQRLIVNAPNREPVSLDLSLDPSQTLDLGSLASRSLVYDPTSPPGATVPSIIARGAGEIGGRIGVEAARQVVIDTYLAVGGDAAGVRDEFGNQLNPQVSGDGLVTLSAPLLDFTAELMARGDSGTLGEVLYALAFLSEWERGSPPTLLQLLAGLQGVVNRAWADPRAPESAVVQTIFNRGNRLLPTPPLLTAETPLSALQRQLLVLGYFAYMQRVRDVNPQLAASVPTPRGAPLLAHWLLERLVPAAQAANPPDPLNLPTDVGIFYSFWKNTLNMGNVAQNAATNTVSGIVTTLAVSKIASSLNATAPGVSAGDFAGAIWGQARGLIVGIGVSMVLRVIQPQPPVVLSASAETVVPPNPPFPGWQKVVVKFGRTNGDRGIANPPGLKFIYRLWRWDRPGAAPHLVGGGQPDEAAAAAGQPQLRTIQVDPSHPEHLLLVDWVPNLGHNLYKVDVIRTVGAQSGEDGDNNIGDGMKWWLSIVPQPSLTAMGGKLSFNPAGTLLAILDPMVQIANGLRLMVSPLSQYISAYVGERRSGADATGGFVVHPNGSAAFESVRADSTIYLISLGTLNRTPFVNTGFIAPYQSGLAIDAIGNLYTENAAGDDRFGGRIFRYGGLATPLTLSPGERTHVGMSNYFSELLGYARPTSVPAMVASLDGQLFIADAIEQQIKKVPVNHTYAANRRVGQPHAASPLFQFGPGMDLARAADNSLYVVQTATDNVLYVPPQGGGAVTLFAPGANLFERPRSLDLDRVRTLYVADEGSDPANGGRILALPLPTQSPTFAPSDCERDRYTLLSGLSHLSFVRMDPFGLRLYYRENGVIHRVGLGFNGQVTDAAGNPVSGAQVRVLRPDGGPALFVTNACGTFRALDLNQSGVVPIVRVEISHPQIGSQVFDGWFDPIGHGFRDFVLNAPTPPPAPDTEPTPVPDPPIALPPPPAPVTVMAASGEVVTAPLIEVAVETVDNGPDPCAGATGAGHAMAADDCDPPTPIIERLTIVSPPDGGPVPQDLLDAIAEADRCVDSLCGPLDTVLSGAKVLLTKNQNAHREVAVRVFSKGVDVTFRSRPYAPSPQARMTIEAHEPASPVAQSPGTVGAEDVQLVVEVKDAAGQVLETRSVRLTPGLEHPQAPGQPGASVIGQVVTAGGGEPLAGVPVKLAETGEVRYTDPNGLYQFPLVPPGPATLSVAPGE